MGKLHQLLAVEKDIKKRFGEVVDNQHKLFTQKSNYFDESNKTYKARNEDDTERPDGTSSPMQSKMTEELEYIETAVIKAVDTIVQKETANSKASANIEIEKKDGTKKVLIENVPVTALVQLENMLEIVRNRIYQSIPTLDPAKTWTKDENANVYVAEAVITQRLRKCQEPIVMYQATDKHPAQTQMITVDRPVGDWTTSIKSCRLSVKEKSDILDRFERLIAGIKIARARANDIEVEDRRIGKVCFNYINGLSD